MDEKLLGKCGFYCGACPTYIKGGCRGCEDEHTTGDCFTRDCVKEKKLNFCGECKNFPCDTIMTKPHSTVLDKDWLAWKRNQRNIEIDSALRLRRFDGNYDFAFEWYQDPETVLLVDGKAEPYSYETLTNMYNYLNGKGELYFIEVNENGKWKPIGDVTFWQEDMPIVIGEREYRGKGIGKKVVSALVERGRTMGYDKLYVGEIYDFNTGSQKCFESVGFRSYEKTEKGSRYVLDLKE